MGSAEAGGAERRAPPKRRRRNSAPALTPRTDKGRFRDGTPKVVSDMSAEERSFARSRKFRKKIRSWMAQNVGAEWGTLGEMERDCANYTGCAMITAHRWLYQYAGPGQEYQIIETEDTYILATRNLVREGQRLTVECNAYCVDCRRLGQIGRVRAVLRRRGGVAARIKPREFDPRYFEGMLYEWSPRRGWIPHRHQREAVWLAGDLPMTVHPREARPRSEGQLTW